MEKVTDYSLKIIAHYKSNWGSEGEPLRLQRGPIEDLPQDFCILRFAPTPARKMWTYATCCMSQPQDSDRVELHMFSPFATEDVVEALTAVAHYHRTGRKLGLGHTVNFGRPWISDSECDHGFVSLPYLDGPNLENLMVGGSPDIRFFWLIPVSKAEVEYKKTQGVEALEQKFDEAQFNYLDPNRAAVV